GVRPVEDHEPCAGRDGRLHGLVHGPDVGVEPGADVLNVEHDRLDVGGAIEVGQLGGGGSVDVVDRHPRARVDVVALRIAGLGRATEPVLRAEHSDHVDLAGSHHPVHQVGQVIQDAGRVGHDTDPLTGQGCPAALPEAVSAG